LSKAIIYNAVRTLAGLCDGASSQDGIGFNKYDSFTGHRLAAKKIEEWSDYEFEYANKMIRKYQGQLNKRGIDISSIPFVVEKKEQKKIDKIVSKKGYYFIIEFPFSYRMVDEVKKIPGVRFYEKGNERYWMVKPNPIIVQPLLKFIFQEQFFYTNEVKEYLNSVVEKLQEPEVPKEIIIPKLKGKLIEFQEEGVAYASVHKKCIIGDEMGTGKTIQALATMEYVDGYPAIIFCPASLKLNWYREIKKWLPHLKGDVINRRSHKVSKGCDFYVINYDITSYHKKALIKLKPKMIIPDEFHYCKNGNTQRTKAVKEIASLAEYVVALTGTAVLNRPFELVSQLEILQQLGKFGSFWGFVRRYCNARRGDFGWDFTGHSNLEELNAKLKMHCYIRRRKEDVLKDLPDKQRTVIPMELDNMNKYKEAEQSFTTWMVQKELENEEFLKKIEDLTPEERSREIADRAQSTIMKTIRAEQLMKVEVLKQLAIEGKMAGIKEWITNFLESGEKLVVFANHIKVQKELLELFPQAAHILGEDSTEERQKNIDRFQNDKDCTLIICSLVAAGVGNTLTAASNVLTVELHWTPGIHDQAEDRIHRIGQKNACNAYYMVAEDTIEEKIYKLIEKKRDITNTIHNGDGSIFTELLEEYRRVS
jgi:SNF2 family DNA or RNA helicase